MTVILMTLIVALYSGRRMCTCGLGGEFRNFRRKISGNLF